MKRNALTFVSFFMTALVMGVIAPLRAVADDDDPSGRVARLSFARGAVSFDPAGTDDWVDAVVNRPVTTGDKLWTDKGARAELHMGSASIRLWENTGFSFLDLSDNVTQIRLTEGTLRVRVKRLEENETFEIDTPNLAFTVLRPGTYSVNVTEVGDTTVVRVLSGNGEVTGGGSAYALHANQVGTFSGTDQLSADVQGYEGGRDDFESWCADRDRREDRSASARYVSDDVVGYEDLDDYGGWRPVPEYGTVWFPRTTVVGWAPYRYGHWAWISPWGWTWVDDAPWGFAPFHYGRWVAVGGAWGWVPCRPRSEFVGVAYVRPVYAPALVAWVGGSHFAVGVAVGGGGNVGWFPLGPREVYVPSYHVSRTYVNNVNISNTTVNTTVVNNYYNNTVVNKNVTNVKYVNQGVPGGVTATSHDTFRSARPVGRNMVKVDQREVASAPVNVSTPAVAPDQKSVLGAGAAARARPPAASQSRAVVAKTPPPPAPISFAKQQAAIQSNGGRPLALSQSRQSQSENTQQSRPNIRIAPPAKLATPQNGPGNRAGQPLNNNVNRPVQPATGRDVGPPPANNDNRKPRNDRPPSSRPNDVTNPNNRNAVNPQLEQKQDARQQQLRQKQEQERQKVEQRQQQEAQKLQEKKANEQRQQQIQQRQQEQREQLQRKHDQQQQKLEQKQQQERQKQEKRPPPKPKDDRPPHS